MAANAGDFTQLAYDTDEKAWLMAIQDKVSKFVLGWAVGPSANTDLALRCWNRSKRSLNAMDLHPAGRIVHSDQDSVFKSRPWLTQLLRTDGVRKSYSERGCKGNSWIESTWSRIKVERRDQIEAIGGMAGLRGFFHHYIPYYNRDRRHSATENKPPIDYLTNALTGSALGGALSRN